MALDQCGTALLLLLQRHSWGIIQSATHICLTRALLLTLRLQWFATYNTLSENLPLPQTLLQKLFRQAFIGFVASVVSDSISNSLRVVKTYRQVNETRIGYLDAAKEVIRVDGVLGLLGRGLKTRIIANGCQGLMFSVLWKLFQDLYVCVVFTKLSLTTTFLFPLGGTRRRRPGDNLQQPAAGYILFSYKFTATDVDKSGPSDVFLVIKRAMLEDPKFITSGVASTLLSDKSATVYDEELRSA